MIRISVIMPVYNKGKNISKSIESVLKQSFKDFELIIINDGSTDDSNIICKKFVNKDKRIKYYEQQNMGVSKTRNTGINLAKGKFISFLDADDFYASNFLEEMYNKISILDGNICYCGHYIVNNSKEKKANFSFDKGNILAAYLKNKCTPNTNSWMIKKSFIIKNNFLFNESLKYGEDMLFFGNLLTKESNVLAVKKFLTYYNVDIKESLSKTNLNNIEADFIWTNLLKESISNCGYSISLKNQLIQIIDNYRLPGSIINTLLLNKNQLFLNKCNLDLNKYYNYINKIKIINGLRSLKLILRSYKTKRLIEKILKTK